jgi:hypothetical protein
MAMSVPAATTASARGERIRDFMGFLLAAVVDGRVPTGQVSTCVRCVEH